MELDLDWRRENSAVWPEVSFEIRPLKVWAFQELLAHWECQSEEQPGEPGAMRVSASQGVKLMEVARRIFPDHVRGLDGMTAVRDGRDCEVTVDMLCEETQMLPLAGEIVSRLVAISEIGSSGEKN